MNLCDALPIDILSPFIECYWYVNASAQETSIIPDAILPNGTCNLIFNLSGFEHREYDAGTFKVSQTLKNRWFSGIRDAALIVGPTVCTKVVGVRFKPGGLTPFVKMPSMEIARLTVEPDEVFGLACQQLHEQLLEAQHVSEQFRLLESWMMARFDTTSTHVGMLKSLSFLDAFSGNVSVSRMARIANLSPRQYRRRFENLVGVTPKRLARIKRFRRLIHLLSAKTNSINWSSIAIDCGYYDQAHLIEDFREFAGVSPGEYLRRNPIVPGFLPINQSMTVFSNTDCKDSGRILSN